MKQIILVLMMIMTMALAGCPGEQAGELFETAKFEELQNNPEHATQLYQEIIKKYPEGEYARKAKERLSELQKNK